MIVKTNEIASFLEKHYTPGVLDETKAELQLSTSEVMNLLFNVFPTDCIDEFEMHEVLTSLGYTPQKKSAVEFVWCFVEK